MNRIKYGFVGLAIIAFVMGLWQIYIRSTPSSTATGDSDRGSIELHIISPDGQDKVVNIRQGHAEWDLRTAFGMPTIEEEVLVKKTVTKDQVLALKGAPCVFIAAYRTHAYLAPDTKYWNGVTYHAGLVPNLGEEGGYTKSLVPTGDSGTYAVAYFKTDRITSDWCRTEAATEGQELSDNSSFVPELCRAPTAPLPCPPETDDGAANQEGANAGHATGSMPE